MKTSLNRIAFSLLVCALLNIVALADSMSKDVTFFVDLEVGDTLVKEGRYKVTFDEQTRELHIIKRGKVIARTTASLDEDAQQDKKKKLPEYATVQAQDGTRLLSRVDVGGRYAIIKNEKIAAIKKAAKAQ